MPAATALNSYMGITAVDNAGTLDITIPGTLTLPGGTYWVSVQDAAPYLTYGQWFWTKSLEQDGAMVHWRNPANGFGTGATTWTNSQTNYYFPWGNYWENCRTQTLYLASELGGGKTITELAWNFQRISSGNPLYNVTVKFLETSVTSLPSGSFLDMSGATEVANISTYIPATSTGWNMLDIVDYEYLGADNLIIEVLWGDNGYWTSTYYRNYKTVGSGNRMLYGYADSESPD